MEGLEMSEVFGDGVVDVELDESGEDVASEARESGKKKISTATRVITLFPRGEDGSACTQLEGSIRSVSALMGEMQIVLAYIIGLKIVASDKWGELLQRVENEHLLRLLETFREGSPEVKRKLSVLSFLLVKLGSRGFDLHGAFYGTMTKFTGLLNMIDVEISSYVGYTNPKSGWVKGEIEKLDDAAKVLQAQFPGLNNIPVNPRLKEAHEELDALRQARALVRYAHMSAFREAVRSYASWAPKVILNAVGATLLGHEELRIKNNQQSFKLLLQEFELTNDPNPKNRQAEAYRWYLEFVEGHSDFMDRLKTTEIDDPHNAWKLLVDESIATFFQEKKKSKVKKKKDDLLSISKEELLKKAPQKWFFKNHILHKKFRAGVTMNEFTPHDGKGHVHHIAYPGPRTVKEDKRVYIFSELDEKSCTGNVSVQLPTGERILVPVNIRKDQFDFLVQASSDGNFTFSEDFAGKRLAFPAHLGGFKPTMLKRKGKFTGEVRIDITMTIELPPVEKVSFDKQRKHFVVNPNDRIGCVAVNSDGRIYFSVYEQHGGNVRLARDGQKALQLEVRRFDGVRTVAGRKQEIFHDASLRKIFDLDREVYRLTELRRSYEIEVRTLMVRSFQDECPENVREELKLRRKQLEKFNRKIRRNEAKIKNLKKDRVQAFSLEIAKHCVQYGVRVLVTTETPNKTEAKPTRFDPYAVSNRLKSLGTLAELLKWIGYHMEILRIPVITQKPEYSVPFCPKCGQRGTWKWLQSGQWVTENPNGNGFPEVLPRLHCECGHTSDSLQNQAMRVMVLSTLGQMPKPEKEVVEVTEE